MSATTNLVRLGRIDLNQRERAPRVSLFHQEFVSNTIKKGIYKCAPADVANEAINGFYRSPTDTEAAENDFLKTDLPFHPLNRDYHYRRALRVVEELFRPSRILKPIAFPDLRYYPWSLNVSAEYPYRDSKHWHDYVRQKHREGECNDDKLNFHNLYDEIFHTNRIHVHSIKYGLSPFWDENGNPQTYGHTYLHSRSHMRKTGTPPKIRAVFGVPKLLLMVENMFIWNLQKEYLNRRVNKGPMLWGYETFRGGWSHLIMRLTGKEINSIISADWSAFDHKALHSVIDDVHDLWRRWFDFENGYEPASSYNHDYTDTRSRKEQVQRLWDWMCHSIKHTPIVAESGNRYAWQFNGFASGFQQTQLLGSFINAIMLLTCLSASGINIESDHFQALFQGDDSISTFPERIDFPVFIQKLSKQAKIRFNADLSTTKTTYGEWFDNIEVLSYRYDGGFAIREPAELLAHLLYPERPRHASEAAAACIGIAQAAMGNRIVYDTCRDIFDFFVKTLGITPDFKEKFGNQIPGLLRWWEPQLTRFPSFEETWAQNFEIGFRSESDKNKLWPLVPTGNGFHFTNP